MLAMLKRTRGNSKSVLLLAVILLTAAVLAAGCGGGPGARVSSFVKELGAGNEQAATSQSYDKYAYQEIVDALSGAARTSSVKIVSVDEEGARKLRIQGYEIKAVPTVEARLDATRAEVEARFKPLIDSARSDLEDAQKELAAARSQAAYAKVTYGPNMPQYYAELSRIAAIQPRVSRAQSKYDGLNAAKAAELQTLTTKAEQDYASEKAARDKAFAAHSAPTRAAVVQVDLAGAKSSQVGEFVLAFSDGTWKLYSYEPKK